MKNFEKNDGQEAETIQEDVRKKSISIANCTNCILELNHLDKRKELEKSHFQDNESLEQDITDEEIKYTLPGFENNDSYESILNKLANGEQKGIDWNLPSLELNEHHSTNFQKTINDLNFEISILESNNEIINDRMHNLETINSDLIKEISKLRNEASTTSSELYLLKSELTIVKRERNEAIAEKYQLQNEINNLQINSPLYTTFAKDNENPNGDTQIDISFSQKDDFNCHNKSTIISTDFQRLLMKAENLDKQLSEMEDNLVNEKMKNAQLKMENEDLKDKCNGYEKFLTAAQKTIFEYKKKLNASENRKNFIQSQKHIEIKEPDFLDSTTIMPLTTRRKVAKEALELNATAIVNTETDRKSKLALTSQRNPIIHQKRGGDLLKKKNLKLENNGTIRTSTVFPSTTTNSHYNPFIPERTSVTPNRPRGFFSKIFNN